MQGHGLSLPVSLSRLGADMLGGDISASTTRPAGRSEREQREPRARKSAIPATPALARNDNDQTQPVNDEVPF